MCRFRNLNWFCLLLLCLTAAPLAAQEDQLPEGKQVIANYLEAIGGKEKLAKVKTIVSKGTVNIPQAGMGGTVDMTVTAEGKAKMVLELEGFGKMESGCDGETVWEMSAMTGAEVLEGERADQTRMQLSVAPFLNYEKLFDTIKCTGIEKFDGVDCYVVESKKDDAKPIIDYFEKANGLHRGSRIQAITGMGQLEIVTKYSDYREIDGLKFSFKGKSELPNNMVQEMEFSSIKLNSEVSPDAFKLPEEVKGLKK